MLRTNLATRPFYNERAVHLALAAAALLILALTAFNVYRVLSLSRQNTELRSRSDSAHAEAQRLTQQAAEIRRTIDQEELEGVVAAASEANALIDQRIFSWTEFFNRIEETLPPDVMLTAVRPSVRDGRTEVVMIVLGRRAEDVDEFMEKLEATGAFEDVLATRQDFTESRLYQVTIRSLYTAAYEEEPAEAPVPQPTPRGAAPAPAGGRVGQPSQQGDAP